MADEARSVERQNLKWHIAKDHKLITPATSRADLELLHEALHAQYGNGEPHDVGSGTEPG